MAERKMSLKDAGAVLQRAEESKLVKSLTRQENRAALIGGAVALAVVAAGLAVLFLTPQGKQARVTMSDAATKGLEAGKSAATKGIEAGKSYAGATLEKVEQKLPALSNLIPVKHNGHTETTASLN